MLIFTEHFRTPVCADWDRKSGAHFGRRQRQKSEDRGTGGHDAVVQEHVQQDAQNRPAFRRYDTRWNYRLSIKQSDEGGEERGRHAPLHAALSCDWQTKQKKHTKSGEQRKGGWQMERRKKRWRRKHLDIQYLVITISEWWWWRAGGRLFFWVWNYLHCSNQFVSTLLRTDFNNLLMSLGNSKHASPPPAARNSVSILCHSFPFLYFSTISQLGIVSASSKLTGWLIPSFLFSY